jgi:transketolase
MRKTCLDMVYELAQKDERVVFIGSDLGPGVLKEFRQTIPDRFYMEGVSEANIIGIAAGLAMEGYIPYVNTIATFLTRRCFEQISMDLCLHNLPVRLIANGGGLVYAPLGPTHIAIDDVALMRSQPNMAVVAPTDKAQMKSLMLETLEWQSPLYIRLGKGGDPIIPGQTDNFKIGQAMIAKPIGDILIAATGVMVGRAIAAAEILEQAGLSCGVIDFHTVKPLDQEVLLSEAAKVNLLVTLDEHFLTGGLGSAITDCLIDEAKFTLPQILRIGIDDAFTTGYGSQDSLMEVLGLQPPQIAAAIQSSFKP